MPSRRGLRTQCLGAANGRRRLLQQAPVAADQPGRLMGLWLQHRRLARESDDLARPAPDFHAGKVTDKTFRGNHRNCVVGKIVLAPPRDVVVGLQQVKPIIRCQDCPLECSRRRLAVTQT